MASTKKTILESNDGKTFEVDKGVAHDNIESMASSLEKIILDSNDSKTFEVDKAVALDNIEAMASSKKKIILKSNDGKNFEVDKAVALQLQMIKYPIEQDWADTYFPLPNVKVNILSKVINYCKMHSDDNVPDYQLKSFDAQFVNVEKGLLFDLVLE
ncbi:hypothetical protein Vadar_003049 [Vaccinium darrowii]|uniref:Uncharacterized protein n=1 Tax=Vaccinium darrowii TaxID=229202 RepID=A0ACB7YBM8_9ERIC|nr:hypothetical protein Vadar_003049 [Vaccinium darrowii]